MSTSNGLLEEKQREEELQIEEEKKDKEEVAKILGMCARGGVNWTF